MNLKQEEADAYEKGLELTEEELNEALVIGDLRLAGTWPRGKPAPDSKERNRLNARMRGLKRAESERGFKW